MDVRSNDTLATPASPRVERMATPARPAHSIFDRFTLTPLNRRRWNNFKANRRGYWSLVIFLVLFVLCTFAEFVANDRPLIVRYKGEFLFPIVADYPETKFGGFLPKTKYEKKHIIDEIEANGWMIWPPVRFAYDTIREDHPLRLGRDGTCLGFPHPPRWSTSQKLCPDTSPEDLQRYDDWRYMHWLGVDANGRDVLARVIYGFRTSMMFGLILTFFSSIIGISAGAVQGYFGGRTDLIMQRILEVWSSIPTLFVLLTVSRVLTPGFWTLLAILLFFSWMTLVGVVRAEFLRARNFEYVRAARALGLSDVTIMFKHLLPNAMVATLTFLPFKLSGAVTALTALDFLGLGLPPGSPSLGELLLQAKKNLEAPHLGIAAFVSIALLLSLLIFIGEAVRDALDPRKTFR